MNRRPLVTLLTDFGDSDYYVAAVKGTILRLAPGSEVIDIAHRVPPGDTRHAAFILAASAPTFPAGTVHLAVVDPGVGSDRRILAARADGQLMVAPDNGLLAPLLASAGRAEITVVDRPDLYLDSPGETFHGRDRFAPITAYLARGEPFEDLGEAPHDFARLPGRAPRRSSGGLRGSVVHVDRFGNLITDLPSAWLVAGPFSARIGRLSTSRMCSHYNLIPEGRAALVPGSLGTLEVSMRGQSAAQTWSIGRGEPVQVDFG